MKQWLLSEQYFNGLFFIFLLEQGSNNTFKVGGDTLMECH